MCKLFSDIASGHAGAADGAATDPEDIISARVEFLSCIVSTADFIAAQRASTSHIWANGLFKAIVNRDASSIDDVHDVLEKLDHLAISWETMCGKLPHAEEDLAVVFNQPLYQHVCCPIAVDAVRRMYYTCLDEMVSYKNILLAVCAFLGFGRVFRVSPRSSKKFMILTTEDVERSIAMFTIAPQSLRSRLVYIAGAAGTTLYQRLLD